MRLRDFGLALLSLSLGLGLAPATVAEPPTLAQDEINYLLATLGASGCEFYRNGSWYDAHTAEAHLRDKYARLATIDYIETAEAFIDQVATRSSLSGRAYAVRCGQLPGISSSGWLYELLARYRVEHVPGAPRAGRGAPMLQPQV
jgi:Family of unknown function (DUF5329)